MALTLLAGCYHQPSFTPCFTACASRDSSAAGASALAGDPGQPGGVGTGTGVVYNLPSLPPVFRPAPVNM